MPCRTWTLVMLLAAALSPACTGGEGENGRGNLGKADLIGSCEGQCGEQSKGSCWCDEECEEFDDCCADKVAVCEEGPSPGNPCIAAGGKCLSDPNDVGFAADCSALGMTKLDAQCLAINQSCCAAVEPADGCADFGGTCVDGLLACPQPVGLPDDACGPMQTCCGADVDRCGGIAGLTCGDDEFCDFAGENCGAADQLGTCKKRPQICTQEFDPVCGCDGSTHSNACSASSAGADVAHAGECEQAGEDCGLTTCSPGTECCNPLLGICVTPGMACIQ